MKRGGVVLLLLGALCCVHPSNESGGVAGNRNPIIHSLVVKPSVMVVGSSANVTVDATDPDNQPLTYKRSASTGDIIGEGATVRYTASFCCSGSNLIRVTVRDNAGGSATQSVDIFIYYR
ncbi:MAG: hypothetical protein C4326_12085 [Ignavibacteria bacterium]